MRTNRKGSKKSKDKLIQECVSVLLDCQDELGTFQIP